MMANIKENGIVPIFGDHQRDLSTPGSTQAREGMKGEVIVDEETIVKYVRDKLATSLIGSYMSKDGALVIEERHLRDPVDVCELVTAKSELDVGQKTDFAHLYLNPTHLRYSVKPGEIFLRRWSTITGGVYGHHEDNDWYSLGVLDDLNLMQRNEWGYLVPERLTISSVVRLIEEIPDIVGFEGTLEGVPLRGKVKNWWNRFTNGANFSIGTRRGGSLEEDKLGEVEKILRLVEIEKL